MESTTFIFALHGERMLTDGLCDMNAVEDEHRITVQQKWPANVDSLVLAFSTSLIISCILTDMLFDCMYTLILRIVLHYL